VLNLYQALEVKNAAEEAIRGIFQQSSIRDRDSRFFCSPEGAADHIREDAC